MCPVCAHSIDSAHGQRSHRAMVVPLLHAMVEVPEFGMVWWVEEPESGRIWLGRVWFRRSKPLDRRPCEPWLPSARCFETLIVHEGDLSESGSLSAETSWKSALEEVSSLGDRVMPLRITQGKMFMVRVTKKEL